MKARNAIRDALRQALRELDFSDHGVPVVLERPREASHGDMSSPVAMSLAKKLRRNPMEIAESIASKLVTPPEIVADVKILKPGFINFHFAHAVLADAAKVVVREGNHYGASDIGSGIRVQTEYVSANPTGPLVVVSARAAAVGSTLVNLLNFQGFEAEGEYYVNDYGKQVDALGESLRFRLKERFGLLEEGAEIGEYPGPYLKQVADKIEEDDARNWVDASLPAAVLGQYASGYLLSRVRRDLEAYGVRFHSFFRESTLHPGAVETVFEQMQGAGTTYEQDGAVFFRSSEMGDDKDRVLKKSTGESTYFLSDIAYHKTKLDRGYDHVIGILGPDHHGHVPRMKAAMSVLGARQDWLEVMIVGWVRLLEGGKPISMSKRAGEYITMRELIRDVGVDVAKYFFLMRRPNSPLDFDLTLARKQSDENPVYYVQYAHARIASVIRFAEEKGVAGEPGDADPSLLVADEERALMMELLYFPLVVEGATNSREPHRMTVYAQELATAFHHFYHECRVVTDDRELSAARLMLARATMQVLRNTLLLLGVTAPSSM